MVTRTIRGHLGYEEPNLLHHPSQSDGLYGRPSWSPLSGYQSIGALLSDFSTFIAEAKGWEAAAP